MLDNEPTGHVIEFCNPVFSDGLNVTVRSGAKWANRVCIGDRLLPTRTGETPPHNSQDRVIGVFYCALADLPAAILRHEHDPACRTKAGLAAELDRIYGPTDYGHRMVTAIVWTRETRFGGGPWGSD